MTGCRLSHHAAVSVFDPHVTYHARIISKEAKDVSPASHQAGRRWHSLVWEHPVWASLLQVPRIQHNLGISLNEAHQASSMRPIRPRWSCCDFNSLIQLWDASSGASCCLKLSAFLHRQTRCCAVGLSNDSERQPQHASCSTPSKQDVRGIYTNSQRTNIKSG